MICLKDRWQGSGNNVWTLSGLDLIHLFLRKSLAESHTHSKVSSVFLNWVLESLNKKHGELFPTCLTMTPLQNKQTNRKTPNKQNPKWKTKPNFGSYRRSPIPVQMILAAFRFNIDKDSHSIFRPFLQYRFSFWATLLKRDFIESCGMSKRGWARWLAAYKSCPRRSTWAYANCGGIALSGEVTAAFKQSERLPEGEGLVSYFSSGKNYRGLIWASMTENL